ncbi:MAG: TetR/AcrR family transcriptional regulator [Sandaracinaceae bacterium]
MGEAKGGSYHHGDLRAALLEGALALIEEGGVSALSLRAVARRVGVSAGAPYHHFPSRSALLAAIAMDGFSRLHAAIDASMEGIDGPERLDACGVGYVRFALSNPAHFRVMFRPELASREEFPEVEECASPVFRHLIGLVQRGQEEGSVPAGDWQPQVLLAWAACHGLASLLLDGPIQSEPDISLDESEVVQVVIKAFGDMLRAAAKA